MQPDFGSVAMTAAVMFLMLYMGGVKIKHYALSIEVLAFTSAALVLSTPYRRDRLMTFLDPWRDPGGKGFQIVQSFVGLNHGGVFGVGLGNGKEKLFFLPEAHNDFIFSVVGEELGYFGVVICIVLFLMLLVKGMKIAFEVERVLGDRFLFFIAAGFTLELSLQAFTNMAVVFGMVPTKGLNLPFVSYGGSSLFIDLLAVGILAAISKKTNSVQNSRQRI